MLSLSIPAVVISNLFSLVMGLPRLSSLPMVTPLGDPSVSSFTLIMS